MKFESRRKPPNARLGAKTYVVCLPKLYMLLELGKIYPLHEAKSHAQLANRSADKVILIILHV